VSVELEMGLLRLEGLVAMAGMPAMTMVAAAVCSSDLVMVMAVAVVVVSKERDNLIMQIPPLGGHHGQPVPLVPPVLLAQVQIYHCY
jgi:hypothetical protein